MNISNGYDIVDVDVVDLRAQADRCLYARI